MLSPSSSCLTWEIDVSAGRWVLLITLAASFYSVGTIWETQMSYGLWAVVGPADFAAYHDAWWSLTGIQLVVFPMAAVAAASSIAMLRWRPPNVPFRAVWLGIALQVAWMVLTAVWWAPLQARVVEARLPDGSLAPDYLLLLGTHWLRVALITFYGIVAFWMAMRSFLPSPANTASAGA
jgi:hypothetical protein